MNIDSLTPAIHRQLASLASLCERDLVLFTAARRSFPHPPLSRRLDLITQSRKETLAWILPILDRRGASTAQMRVLGFLPSKYFHRLRGAAISKSPKLVNVLSNYSEQRFARRIAKLLREQGVSPKTRFHLMSDSQRITPHMVFGRAA